MAYTIDRTIEAADFEAVDARMRKALGEHGFGVLTEIDVRATMTTTLGAEMPPHRILGACNPEMAMKVMEIEPRIGAMLPCNVILRQVDGAVEISAVDPVASMQAVASEALNAVAGGVRDRLRAAVAAA